jgi:hypothetical protein
MRILLAVAALALALQCAAAVRNPRMDEDMLPGEDGGGKCGRLQPPGRPRSGGATRHAVLRHRAFPTGATCCRLDGQRLPAANCQAGQRARALEAHEGGGTPLGALLASPLLHTKQASHVLTPSPPIHPQVLDWDARIFYMDSFLSPEECDHIRKISEARMERSGVVETETGGSAVSEIRTSYGVFLDRGEDEVVKGEQQQLLLQLLPKLPPPGAPVIAKPARAAADAPHPPGPPDPPQLSRSASPCGPCCPWATARACRCYATTSRSTTTR